MSATRITRTEEPPAAQRWSARQMFVAATCLGLVAWCLVLAAAMGWQHRWADLGLVLLGTAVVCGASEQLWIREGRR